jgi:hypothetical protein
MTNKERVIHLAGFLSNMAKSNKEQADQDENELDPFVAYLRGTVSAFELSAKWVHDFVLDSWDDD